MRDRTVVKFEDPEEGADREGDNSESYARGWIWKDELNRKIDHEPEGNIGIVYLVLFIFFFIFSIPRFAKFTFCFMRN